MALKDPTTDFNEDQKRYLEGFLSGIDTLRHGQGLGGVFTPDDAPEPMGDGGPDAPHLAAQARTEKAGRKLVKEEVAKREKPALDSWKILCRNAEIGQFPEGTDVFRYKFHGLFYTAPNQDSYMCRLRLANGIASSTQARGVADIAEQYAGGYAHVTTRANLQIREIDAASPTRVLMGLQDLGIINRGSGADNVRNITGDPLAGVDPQALIDTRPLCREMHYHILNHRELFGLPRKFNIAFNGGGRVRGVSDTNDIDFTAVEADGDVCFRLGLGGIPGHGDFADFTPWLLAPDQCVPVADAVLRVFLEEGDRSDRKKARLKYVLDRMGIEAFLERVREKLDFEPALATSATIKPAEPPVADAHIGAHELAGSGTWYVGVAVPFGRLEAYQLRGLADLAETCGDASLRFTVWQNLIIAGIPEASLDDARAAIEAMGLRWSVSYARAGIIACTGSFGCKFAASDTKQHAAMLADHLDETLELDQPLNIHLTGCPNSCAQHTIADIGLLGTGVEAEDDEMVEGYDVFLGGGFGEHQSLGEKIFAKVQAPEVPPLIARVLGVYQTNREGRKESFQAFVSRQGVEAIKSLVEAV